MGDHREGLTMEDKKRKISRRLFLKSSALAGAGAAAAGASGGILRVGEARAQVREEFPIYFKWDRPIYPKAKPKLIFRMGHSVPANVYTSSQHTQAVVFKNVVERTTGGDIRVDIVPARGLGDDRQMIQQTKDGTIQGCVVPEGSVPIFFPEYNVLSIPFVFKTHAVAWKVLDGPFGQEFMTEFLKKLGIRAIALAENGGFRNFITRSKPIHSPKDVAGLKLRVQQHEGHMAFIKALGGSAHPIPMQETYVALQTNVVDGLELPIPVINMFKIYEVTKYLTLDAHIYGVDTFFINDAWFQKLPNDLKNVIIEAGYQTATASRGTTRVQDWEVLAKIEKNLEEVYAPTSDEQQAFVKAAQPAYLEWYHSKVDPKQVWSTKLFAAVKKAEESIWGKGYVYG